MREKFIGGIAALFATATLGCYALKPMPKLAFEQCGYRHENGIKIGIEPFETERESKEVFQVKTGERGYVAVFELIANDSARKIHLDRDKVRFVHRSGEEWMRVDGSEMGRSFDSGAAETILTGVVSPVIGLGVGIAAHNNNVERRKDFEDKGMPSQLEIYPNGIERRFVYFRKPKTDLINQADFERELRGARVELEAYFEGEGVKKFSWELGEASDYMKR